MKVDDIIVGHFTTIDKLKEGEEFLLCNTIYRFNIKNVYGNYNCWNTYDHCTELISSPYTKVVRLLSGDQGTYMKLLTIDKFMND